jgi:hypothetical protein
MTLVRSVPMTVVDEVGVIAVADRHVAAFRTVDVIVAVMRCVSVRSALVPVVVVGAVGVTIVQVVGVVAVVHRDVPAVLAVVVAVVGVGAVSGVGHGWCSSVVGS